MMEEVLTLEWESIGCCAYLDGAEVYMGGEKMRLNRTLKDVKTGDKLEIYFPTVFITAMDVMAPAPKAMKVMKDGQHNMMRPTEFETGTICFNIFLNNDK